MPPKNQRKTVKKTRPARRAQKKKGNSFMQDLGAVAKGVYNVAKVAAPLVGLLPFETSNQYAMTSGGSGAAINSVAAPVANATTTRTLKANIRRSKAGNMYVTHREYIGDIVLFANDLFNVQMSQNINPGNGSLFPWLANIAQNFEKFSFKRLHFIYEPQSSTSTPGTVMMAVDWDSKDLDPDSKVEMMSYENAVRSPAWFAASYTSSPHNLSTQKNYFVTDGGTNPSGTDIHFYSVGKFILATMSDSGVATSIGELYVDYEVELITPQLEYSCPSVAISAVIGTAYGTTTPLGSASTPWVRYGDLGIQLKLNQTNNSASPGQGILFPVAGQFTLMWRYSSGTLVGSNSTITFSNIAGEGTEDIQVLFPTASGAVTNVGAGFLFNDTNGGAYGGICNLNVKSPGSTLFMTCSNNFTANANSTAYFQIASVDANIWGVSGTSIIPTLTMEPRSKRKFISSVKQVRNRVIQSVNNYVGKDSESLQSHCEVGEDSDESNPSPLQLSALETLGKAWNIYISGLTSQSPVSPTKFIASTLQIPSLYKQEIELMVSNYQKIQSSIIKMDAAPNWNIIHGLKLVKQMSNDKHESILRDKFEGLSTDDH